MKNLLAIFLFWGIAISSLFGQPFSIHGTFIYNNAANTPIDNLKVVLKLNSIPVDSTVTSASGYYQFTGLTNNTYTIEAYTSKPWSGINGTDALTVERHFTGIEQLTIPIKLTAADVNNSGAVNGTDALKIKRRFVGVDNVFDRGDWSFEKVTGGNTIIIAGADVTENLYGLCIGDVNGSNTPLPTEELPTVTTASIVNITQNSASGGGNVFADGGLSVSVKGVCWSLTTGPTIADNHTTDGSGTGVFVSSMPGLSTNTPYHVRAYATNSLGTAYGTEVTFSTLPDLPIITTTAVTNITQTTATSGGTVSNDGGGPVLFRGVCWSINPNPTISDSLTIDGNGTGVFVSNLTNLLPNTRFYIRAYATNSAGTSYGNEVTFNNTFHIGKNFGGGIIFYIDNDGQNGLISATTDQSTGAPWGCYGTLIGGTSTALGSGQANTAAIVNGCSTAGIAARICDNLVLNGYSDWYLPSLEELNQMCLQKTIIGNLSPNVYYSSSEWSDLSAWMFGFSGDCSQAYYYKNNQHYVRAIRAFSTLISLPAITTTAVTDITQTTASGGGNVTSDGGDIVTLRGVCWSRSANPTTAGNHTTDGGGTGAYVSSLTGLLPNTTYYIRGFATNGLGTAYGNEVSFTTQPWPCGSSSTIIHLASGSIAPVDKTVTYGTVTGIPGEPSKCWITSNLGADHQATAVNDATEASAGWYWQFNLKQGYKHDGITRIPNTDWITYINENLAWQATNDPCALELGGGWRIPTPTEWENVDAVGNWINWLGPWNSGLKLHAAGFLIYAGTGSLLERGMTGAYWSSSQANVSQGWSLYFDSNDPYLSNDDKADGMTLRCIRD